MGEISSREILQEMTDQSIGSPGLMAEAERITGTKITPSSALKEAAKRACKIWLPAGKRSANSEEDRARRQAIREQQIDIEEAIEAAGGQRGRMRPKA